MIEYVTIGERALLVGTPESTAYTQQELREEGISHACVWASPQATLEDAADVGFEGARQTHRVLYQR